jgi:hypothetical protein
MRPSVAILCLSAECLAGCDGADDDVTLDATVTDASAGDARAMENDAANDGTNDAMESPPDAGRSVLQHHNHASRDGL